MVARRSAAGERTRTINQAKGDGPEPAQPAQQVRIASWGGRELPDAEQPADGIQRGGDMGTCVGAPRRR